VAEIPDRAAGLLYSFMNLVAGARQHLPTYLRRTFLCARSGLQKCGDSDAALDDGVVQFARQSSAFFQYCRELLVDALYTLPVQEQHYNDEKQYARENEPAGLVPRGALVIAISVVAASAGWSES
jgi:hypothetical protein